MSSVRRTILLLIITIAAFSIALAFQRKSAAALAGVLEPDDRYYLPPSHWLRAFSLGYTEAAADFVWVKTILYFGEKVGAPKRQGDSKYLTNYLLSAVDLDPRFRSCYSNGSSLTLFHDHGRVTKKTIEMATSLLERGIAIFPDDGELFFSLGFMHYYEMARFLSGDASDPLTKKHRNLGRYYIGRSALMPGAPPYASMLAATLMMKDGMDAAVVEHLKAMLLQETDPGIREELIAKIRLEMGKAVEADIAETDRLQRAWREKMPYVPYDFYLMLQVDTPVEERLDPLYPTNTLLGLNEPMAGEDGVSSSALEPIFD